MARKNGETILVQCKQWKAQKVGVNTIREMFGLLNAESANEVHVVASGSYTEEARSFARGKPIRLIDGPQLLDLVRNAQSTTSKTGTTPEMTCPVCGSDMVLRTARKGPTRGTRFWGCAGFPSCRGTRKAAQ